VAQSASLCSRHHFARSSGSIETTQFWDARISSTGIRAGRKNRVLPHQPALLHQGWVSCYDLNGKVVAYSDGLIPVRADKMNGQWKIDDEAAGIFFAAFVEDKATAFFAT
jgi:hypothetical protein